MRLFRIMITFASILLCLSCTTSNTIAQNNGGSDNASSHAYLDQILAPIALYPDTLLSHILIAATYPLEVVEAQRWSIANDRPAGDAALEAVESETWDPSVKALTAFPQILEKMSHDLRWTQDLGNAFLDNEMQLLARVQTLRQHAHAAGSLDDLEYAEVSEDEAHNIVIESRTREVVYVPHYDTRVVYGPWWWHDHPPIYWAITPGISFYWGPRIRVSSGFYFSAFNWHSRNLVVINHHRGYSNFNSGRQVVRHAGARRWVHNPAHRRNVHYSNRNVKAKYSKWYEQNRSERYNQPKRRDINNRDRNGQDRSTTYDKRHTNNEKRAALLRAEQTAPSASRSRNRSTAESQRTQNNSSTSRAKRNTNSTQWRGSEQQNTSKTKIKPRNQSQQRLPATNNKSKTATRYQNPRQTQTQQNNRSTQSSSKTKFSRVTSEKRKERDDSK